MLYTADEVAENLGLTARTVRNRAAKNKIGQKFGRDWVFTQSDIEKLKETPTSGRPVTTGAGLKRRRKKEPKST